MDIEKINTGIRINTKNASFVIDPTSSAEADAFIFTSEVLAAYDFLQDKLVISGVGEYEIRGITIRAKREGENLIYEVSDGGYNIVILPSSIINKIEADEYDALLIKLVSKVDASSLPVSAISILFGEKELINQNVQNFKKTNKLSLKRKEQWKDTIVYLG